MSITFESPSQRRQGEAYFTPMTMPNSILTTNSSNNNGNMASVFSSGDSNNISNTEESGSTTPYFTAPINPMLNQDFMNAIHQRHSSQPTVFSPTMERKPVVTFGPMGSIADRRRAARQQQQQQSTAGLLPISPEQLTVYLKQPSSTLVFDVRSFVQFSHARIRKAISVSVPNTILKRPTFTMDKLYEAIAEADRPLLKQWSSFAVIIFYDQSSMLAPEQCATSYLANKMIHAGFKGSLFYLRGGYDAFEALYPDQCLLSTPQTTNGSNSLPFPRNKNIDINNNNNMKTPSLRLGSLPPPSSATPFNFGPYTAPMPQFENQAFNPFFSNIRQNMELSHGPIKERFPIRLPDHCHPVLHDGTLMIEMDTLDPMPRALAGATLETNQQGKRIFKVPRWLQRTMIDHKSGELGTVALSELYEKLERTEQRRLQNIMHFHSKDTATDPSDYPLSIVAGIEMGTLNRYTNIWPFEYTRVKIQDTPSGSTGYINASFIQYYQPESTTTTTTTTMTRSSDTSNSDTSTSSLPSLSSLDQKSSSPTSSVSTISPTTTDKEISTSSSSSSSSSPISPSSGQINPSCLKMMKSPQWYQQPYRRYISTQGPLPSTFDDFWQVVWEQNSRVVVMLTKEEEMNKTKCHRYWPSELNRSVQYGATRLTLISQTEHKITAISEWKEDMIYEREFTMEKPDQPIRHVTQLHYTGWMDYGVPDNPLGTLQLIQLADRAQRKYESICLKQVIGPMVIHCSAGCGRSGAFCAIDTVLRRLILFDDHDSITEDPLWDIIFKFREQRLSMVQTLRQFVFCYEVVWWWFLGYGRLQDVDGMEF